MIEIGDKVVCINDYDDYEDCELIKGNIYTVESYEKQFNKICFEESIYAYYYPFISEKIIPLHVYQRQLKIKKLLNKDG